MAFQDVPQLLHCFLHQVVSLFQMINVTFIGIKPIISSITLSLLMQTHSSEQEVCLNPSEQCMWRLVRWLVGSHYLDVALSCQVVDLHRLHLQDNLHQTHAVSQITIMQLHVYQRDPQTQVR